MDIFLNHSYSKDRRFEKLFKLPYNNPNQSYQQMCIMNKTELVKNQAESIMSEEYSGFTNNY